MITPEKFWEELADGLRHQFENPETGFREYYFRGREWTSRMTEFLCNLAHTFNNCHVDCEYWPRVDVAYFDKCTTSDWDKWCMEVAIEHEIGWYWEESELCKLMMVNAGLKVMIAYDDDPLAFEKNGFFDKFIEILQSRQYNNRAHWLFIIGPRTIANGRDYFAFSSDGITVKEITDGRKILQPSSATPQPA